MHISQNATFDPQTPLGPPAKVVVPLKPCPISRGDTVRLKGERRWRHWAGPGYTVEAKLLQPKYTKMHHGWK